MQLQAELASVLCSCMLLAGLCTVMPLSHVPVALQTRIGDLVTSGESVPLAVYTSLEHFGILDKATDEDFEDVIDSGILDVSWSAVCDGLQIDTRRGIRVSYRS